MFGYKSRARIGDEEIDGAMNGLIHTMEIDEIQREK